MGQGWKRIVGAVALVVAVGAPAVTNAGAAGAEPGIRGDGAQVASHGTSGLTWPQVVERRAGLPATAATNDGATAPLAAVAPVLTVTPATDLVSGQVVEVAGSGFPAIEVIVVQCRAGGTTPEACDLDTVNVTAAGDAGTFAAPVRVHRTARTLTGSVDCATAVGACDMIAVTLDVTGAVVSAPLGFDPDAPGPDPKIAVVPASDLRSGDAVTVTGEGFVPGDVVSVTQCATTDPFCTFFDEEPITVDAGGRFSTSVVVHLRVADELGGSTHCLAVPCEIRAASLTDAEYAATAPLAFDPDQPLPAVPEITVVPAVGLRHRDQVVIDGTGFDPDGEIDLGECGPSVVGFCFEYLGTAVAGPDGTFSATVNVTRLVREFDFATGEDVIVDCATTTCSISADQYGPVSLRATAPITLRADVPPPTPPTVAVTPTTDLPYRSELAVHGTGFSPGGTVIAQFCARSVDDGTCTFEGGFGIADATGSVDLTVVARRRFPSFGGSQPIDCIDPGTECSVVVQGQFGFEQSEAAVTFDPESPIPPPATGSATPDRNLHDGDVVTVTGEHLVPGPTVVQQCVDLGEEFSFGCFAFPGLATVAADGTLETTFTVARFLDDGESAPIDCRVERCYLLVGSPFIEEESARIPLHFSEPELTLHGVSVVEGTGGVTATGVRVRLSEPAPAPVAVQWNATPDNATVGADYTAPGGVVTIPKGATQATIPVQVVADAVDEPNERFTVRLSDDPGVQVGDGDAIVNIVDDDATPTVEIRDGVANEHDGFGRAEVLLSAPSGRIVVVHYRTHDETARDGSDYTAKHSRLVFLPGETRHVIRIALVDDHQAEPDEKVQVLSHRIQQAGPAELFARIRIVDDDGEHHHGTD